MCSYRGEILTTCHTRISPSINEITLPYLDWPVSRHVQLRLAMAAVTVVNIAFRLHYQVFSLVLLVSATLIFGFTEYYRHRRCFPDVPLAHVFCSESLSMRKSYLSGILLFQSIMFCFTYLLRSYYEDSEMRTLLTKRTVKGVANDLLSRGFMFRRWVHNLIFCELLNVVVVLSQAVVIDYQLNGKFMDVGSSAIHMNGTEMLTLFPKTQVCALLIPGRPAMQTVCDMPLHYCYEMVFVVLWFSLSFLTILSFAVLFWRMLTLGLNLCSSRWVRNQLEMSCKHRLTPDVVDKLKCYFGCFDWVFLKYLAKNMGPARFYDLILELTSEEEPDNFCNEKLALKL